MKQELTEKESLALDEVWQKDLSVGGPPDGWTKESFIRMVEDGVYNGRSFKTALMHVLSKVPRPGDLSPVESKKVKLAQMLEELQAKKSQQYQKSKENKIEEVSNRIII